MLQGGLQPEAQADRGELHTAPKNAYKQEDSHCIPSPPASAASAAPLETACSRSLSQSRLSYVNLGFFLSLARNGSFDPSFHLVRTVLAVPSMPLLLSLGVAGVLTWASSLPRMLLQLLSSLREA